MTRTTEMTVTEFRSTQTVWPAWMQEACTGATVVAVTTRSTFAGRFVVNVERVA